MKRPKGKYFLWTDLTDPPKQLSKFYFWSTNDCPSFNEFMEHLAGMELEAKITITEIEAVDQDTLQLTFAKPLNFLEAKGIGEMTGADEANLSLRNPKKVTLWWD
jgi:hypothetical protein